MELLCLENIPRHPYFPQRGGASARSPVRGPFVRRGTSPSILVCPTRFWSRRGTYSRIVHDRQRVLECVTREHARTHVASLPSRPGVSLVLCYDVLPDYSTSFFRSQLICDFSSGTYLHNDSVRRESAYVSMSNSNKPNRRTNSNARTTPKSNGKCSLLKV